MKTLLKAMETQDDLTRFMNFCEAHGIATIARSNDRLLSLGDIDFDNYSINWGGYGSSFEVSPALFSYFKLEYPSGNPPRGKSFAHVKMVISGKLSDHDVDEVTAKVESKGGLVVSSVDKSVNLLVVGAKPNAKLVKKAESLGQVVILDEKRFAALLPAPRKAPKPTPQTIDKKALANLKKLLASRDIDRVLQGLELLRSLENVDAYNYFLDGVSADQEGNPVPSSMFKGTGPAQPFLNVSLLGIIGHAPKECEIATALRKSLTNLEMQLASLEPLSAFPNLKSLNLSGSEDLKNLDGLPESKKLRSVDLSGCGAIENVDGLSVTSGITKVDFSDCRSLQNVDVLANNLKLSRVNLDGCRSLENIDGLSKCASISKIELNDCSSLENIDGLAGCTNLTALALDGCSSLENLDGLAKATKLKSLDLYGCWDLKNLDGLKGCKDLAEMRLGYNLTHVDGLSHLKSLKDLELNGCDELSSLKGLSGCTNLNRLVVSSPVLENVDGLARCKNLTTLEMDYCLSLKNVDGLAHCTKLKSLSLAGCKEVENLDGLLKCTELTNLALEECTALKNLDGLANLTKLKVEGSVYIRSTAGYIYTNAYFDLGGCNSLQDVGGLAGCKKISELRLGNSDREELPSGLDKLGGLKELHLMSSTNLKHVDQLADCPKLVELHLNDCRSLENVAGLLACTKLSKLDLGGGSKNVKPKPAKLGMSSRSEVEAYMARVQKEFAPDTPDKGSKGGSKKAGKPKKPAGKKKASKKRSG